MTDIQSTILYLMYLKGLDGHAMLCGADATGDYDLYLHATLSGADAYLHSDEDEEADKAWERDARYLHAEGYITGNDTHDYYASYTLTPKGAALFTQEEN